jgi:hypothetical protein
MDHIQKNFEKFHRDNPRVYYLFKRFAKQWMNVGYEHGSAKQIYERIRWETAVETTSNAHPTLKINNNYTSRYARMWHDEHPEYPNFFRTRQLHPHSSDGGIFI